MSITWSEVSRGVPRSLNRHLGQSRIFRQYNIAGCKVEFDSLSDVRAGFVLGFTSRRAARELGAHRRVIAGLGIMFQNDSERHSNSIRLRDSLGYPGSPAASALLREGGAT